LFKGNKIILSCFSGSLYRISGKDEPWGDMVLSLGQDDAVGRKSDN